MYERHTIETPDGCRLAVFVSTNAAPERTVILAHGWSLDHHTWDKVAGRLIDAGHRVITWDQRGHGDSTLPYRGEASIRALARDLALIINTYAPHGDLVLAGHSMGGMTMLAYAGLYPDVVTARVSRLVLVSTSAGDLRIPNLSPFVAIAGHITLRLGPLVTASSQRIGGFGKGANRADVRLARGQVGATRLSTMTRFYSALRLHNETASLTALAQSDVRILVGSRDLLTPLRHAQALADALPDAHLDILPGLGHMLPYEAPDAVFAAITGFRAEV